MKKTPRTPLRQRVLPDYTTGEERFNSISHLLGAAIGVVVLVACVVRSALHGDAWAVVGSAIYGVSVIALFAMSGIYHGVNPQKAPTAKLVLQVIDHCTIYVLIAGTYTPILFVSIRPESPAWAWVIFGIVWGVGIMAMVFTAIDLKKYRVLSMVCYICLGWCIVIATPIALRALPAGGLLWLLGGGIAYTVGAIFYGVGAKKRYMHGVFHVFVLLGSIMHSIFIYFFVLA
ncbi:MAG: hemolysin III family protein [Coriobacteriales bacterium]|nr:hemolysin III family protein [Coriobacteriales bacterium]